MTKATFHNGNTGGERKVYVYTGLNEHGQPVEVFVTDERGDAELKPYASALGKLISLGLKHGIDPKVLAHTMEGLAGPSIAYGDKVSQSVPDLVSKLLFKAADAPAPIVAPTVTPLTTEAIDPTQVAVAQWKGALCGKCGQYAFDRTACICRNCDFSKC